LRLFFESQSRLPKPCVPTSRVEFASAFRPPMCGMVEAPLAALDHAPVLPVLPVMAVVSMLPVLLVLPSHVA
jgi:hypothetical protein